MEEPNKKITDAAMMRSIITSVIGIVLCMACLFGTTWAWYITTVESGENVTVGANLGFEITVQEEVTQESGVYRFPGGEHQVTVKRTGTAQNGFCHILATEKGKEAGTAYLVEFQESETFTFCVTGSGTLKFTPMWGTPTGKQLSAAEDEALPEIQLKPDPDLLTAPEEDPEKAQKEPEQPEKTGEETGEKPAEEPKEDEKPVEEAKESKEDEKPAET